MVNIKEINRVRANAELIFSMDQIDTALDRMADQITKLLSQDSPLVLSVMNGGIVATAQLMLRINIPIRLDSLYVSRYHNTTRGQEIQWLKEPSEPIRGHQILIIDDVLDEGITLANIKDYCMKQGAGSVYTAVLVEKRLAREKPIKPDIVGLTSEDRYLFGYGMDYKGYLRNTRGIYACSEASGQAGLVT